MFTQGLSARSTCPPSPRRPAPSPAAAMPDLRIGSGMCPRVTWQSHHKLAWGSEATEALPVPSPSAPLGCQDEAAGLGCASGWGSQRGLFGGRRERPVCAAVCSGPEAALRGWQGVCSKHHQLLVSGVLCGAVCSLQPLLSWPDCVK